MIMQVGRVALIPYRKPGDPALGDLLAGLAADHSAALLANHGPIVCGATLEKAVFAMEELEETAKLLMLCEGRKVRYLSTDQIAELKPQRIV